MTTYITNLSLTDNWKHTTCQFLSYFKQKLCLLDSLAPLRRFQEQFGSPSSRELFRRTMTSDRSMFLILFGDLRLVPQESSLLESTMTYLVCRMSPQQCCGTQEKIGFHFSTNSGPDPAEDTLLDRDEVDSSPYSSFKSCFNSLELQNPTESFVSMQIWGEFPEAAKKLIIEYSKEVKVVSPKTFQCWKP